MSTPPPPSQTSLQKPTLPIHTLHCSFCSHLLLATTRSLSTLTRRQPPAADNALILPLEKLRSLSSDPNTTTSSSKSQSNHVTLLLSTTVRDKRATLIRREDGIDKRILLRCGRCRVVVGYYLDEVHWKSDKDNGVEGVRAEEGEEEDRVEEQFPAIYVLPGALVETEGMGKEGLGEEEWRRWVGDS